MLRNTCLSSTCKTYICNNAIYLPKESIILLKLDKDKVSVATTNVYGQECPFQNKSAWWSQATVEKVILLDFSANMS